MRKLRETYLTPAKNRWIAIKEWFMTKIIINTDKYFFEDTLSVLLKVMEKNSFLLEGKEIDIEDFYEGRYNHYEYYFKSITKFYDMLRRRMKKQNNLYMDKFLTITG
jgi:hypothetical protein